MAQDAKGFSRTIAAARRLSEDVVFMMWSFFVGVLIEATFGRVLY